MRHRVGVLVIAFALVPQAIPSVAGAQSSTDLRTPRGFSSGSPGPRDRSPDLRAPAAFGASGSPSSDLRTPGSASANPAAAQMPPEFVAQLHRGCASPSTAAVTYTPPAGLLRNDRRGTPTVRPPVDTRRNEVQSIEASIASMNATDPRRADLLLRAATTTLDLAADTRAAGREQDARDSLRHAVALLESFTTAYTSHARGDLALFLLGLARGDLGDPQGMRRVFLQVVRDYPQSAYVPYVYANFGEYFFAQGVGPNANQFFDRVRTFGPGTPLWAFATFRMAGIAATGGDWQQAQQLFATVVQWARTSAEGASLPGIEGAAMAGFCSAAASRTR